MQEKTTLVSPVSVRPLRRVRAPRHRKRNRATSSSRSSRWSRRTDKGLMSHMHELRGEPATSIVPNDELAHLRLMQSTVEHAHDYVMIVEWTGGEPPYLIRYVNE